MWTLNNNANCFQKAIKLGLHVSSCFVYLLLMPITLKNFNALVCTNAIARLIGIHFFGVAQLLSQYNNNKIEFYISKIEYREFPCVKKTHRYKCSRELHSIQTFRICFELSSLQNVTFRFKCSCMTEWVFKLNSEIQNQQWEHFMQSIDFTTRVFSIHLCECECVCTPEKIVTDKRDMYEMSNPCLHNTYISLTRHIILASANLNSVKKGFSGQFFIYSYKKTLEIEWELSGDFVSTRFFFLALGHTFQKCTLPTSFVEQKKKNCGHIRCSGIEMSQSKVILVFVSVALFGVVSILFIRVKLLLNCVQSIDNQFDFDTTF